MRDRRPTPSYCPIARLSLLLVAKEENFRALLPAEYIAVASNAACFAEPDMAGDAPEKAVKLRHLFALRAGIHSSKYSRWTSEGPILLPEAQESERVGYR